MPFSTKLPARDPILEFALKELIGARRIPERLFHYTSSEACFSILNAPANQEPMLWASSAFCTNDATEVQYGLELVQRLARQVLPLSDDLLQRLPFETSDTFREKTCVVCFCEEPDLLSQWRAYSRGGAGYAIGFDREGLVQAGNTLAFTLLPVIYGKEEQEEALRILFKEGLRVRDSPDELDKYWAILREQESPGVQAWVNSLYMRPPEQSPQRQEYDTADTGFLSKVVALGASLAMSFKNESFREEGEWRLVSRSPVGTEMKFRASNWGVVPYVEIPFSRDAITEIWLGPILNQELAERTLTMYFKSQLLTNASPIIHRSKIPLRSL